MEGAPSMWFVLLRIGCAASEPSPVYCYLAVNEIMVVQVLHNEALSMSSL